VGTSAFRILPNVAQKWRATYNAGCWFEDVRNGFVSAGNTPVTPTTTLTSTNVQAALQELDGDIQGLPTLIASDTAKMPIGTSIGPPAVTTINVANLATLADVAGATGAAITVKDEGTNLTTALASLDFTGPGVTASNTAGAVTINVPAAAASGDVSIFTTTDGYSSVNTTQQVDTPFVMPLAANSKYLVDVAIFFTADTGADIKSSIRSSTTGWTFLFSCLGHSIASTSAAPAFYCQGFDQLNFTWTFGSIAAPPAVQSWQGKGIVVTGANAGNLEFWYAQNAPLASPATIRKAGSYFVAKKIA
jgi:hypothetical protein